MNAAVTSKEAIMLVCRQIVAQKGLTALNMRAVARECGIALGTLYNYYADKDELLMDTVESVWRDIFHTDRKCETISSFSEYIISIYDCIQKGAEKYPNFLTAHSISIAKAKRGEAKSTMEQYFEHMKTGMLSVLQKDPAVDPAAFSESFTESDLAEFVLDNILLLQLKEKTDCIVLVELVKRAVYRM